MKKFVSLSTGVRIEYVEQGKADGVPVIFLHGVTDSWRSFERVLPLRPPNIHAFALSQRGQITHGVVYDPVRNDLFTATRGRGAFLNDRRIRVSKRDHLRDCLIGTGFPFRDGSYLDTYLRMMKTMIEQTAGLRRPGAAALDLAYVAAGFYDGFWEVGLNPWDVAAGSLLVQEAGGLIGDLSGEGDFLHGGQVIAANPKVFAQMVTTLAPYRSELARERPPAVVDPAP